MTNGEQDQADRLNRIIEGDLPERQASELNSLAELAGRIREMPRLEPARSAVDKCLARIAPSTPQSKRSVTYFRQHAALAWAASVLLLIVVGGGITIAIAESSIPGHLTYPVKRAAENVRLFMAISPEGKAELCVCFSERRMQEVIALSRKGSVEPATLNAMLDATGHAIEVAGRCGEPKRQAMLEQVGMVCGYQRDALCALQNWVPVSDTALINSAIAVCASRWENCVCCGNCDPNNFARPR